MAHNRFTKINSSYYQYFCILSHLLENSNSDIKVTYAPKTEKWGLTCTSKVSFRGMQDSHMQVIKKVVLQIIKDTGHFGFMITSLWYLLWAWGYLLANTWWLPPKNGRCPNYQGNLQGWDLLLNLRSTFVLWEKGPESAHSLLFLKPRPWSSNLHNLVSCTQIHFPASLYALTAQNQNFRKNETLPPLLAFRICSWLFTRGFP